MGFRISDRKIQVGANEKWNKVCKADKELKSKGGFMHNRPASLGL